MVMHHTEEQRQAGRRHQHSPRNGQADTPHPTGNGVVNLFLGGHAPSHASSRGRGGPTTRQWKPLGGSGRSDIAGRHTRSIKGRMWRAAGVPDARPVLPFMERRRGPHKMGGPNLITHLDDASRRATGAALFGDATSESAAAVLRQAMGGFGMPATILSGNGSCFVGAGGRKKPNGTWTPALFESELLSITLEASMRCRHSWGCRRRTCLCFRTCRASWSWAPPARPLWLSAGCPCGDLGRHGSCVARPSCAIGLQGPHAPTMAG